jgi:hypothetical protein
MSVDPACPVCLTIQTRPFWNNGTRNYWRCEDCQATFLDPGQRPGTDEEHAEYALHENALNDPGYRRFLARLANPLLERLTPGQNGLDYGCGPAPALAAMLGEAGYAMALYDPLFQKNQDALNTHYDFITCTEVVEHFHRPHQEFSFLDTLLEPGGLLAIMTCFQTDDAAFANWHYRRDPTHVVFYRPHTFRTIARQRNWQCQIPCPNVVFLRKGNGSQNHCIDLSVP